MYRHKFNRPAVLANHYGLPSDLRITASTGLLVTRAACYLQADCVGLDSSLLAKVVGGTQINLGYKMLLQLTRQSNLCIIYLFTRSRYPFANNLHVRCAECEGYGQRSEGGRSMNRMNVYSKGAMEEILNDNHDFKC